MTGRYNEFIIGTHTYRVFKIIFGTTILPISSLTQYRVKHNIILFRLQNIISEDLF